VGRRRSRGRVGPPRVAEPLVSRRPSRRTEPPPSDCPRRGRAHATPPPPGCCGLSPAGHPNRRLLLDRRVRKDEVDQAGPPDRAAGARRDRHRGHAAPEHPHPRRSPTAAPSRAGRDHCPPRGASQLSDPIRSDVGRRGQPRQRSAATPPSRIGSCRLPHLAAGRWRVRTPRQPEHAVHLKGQRARHARWPSALPCRGHHGQLLRGCRRLGAEVGRRLGPWPRCPPMWGTSARNDEGPPSRVALREWLSGGVLLSHAVTRAVPSAHRGLASGFGMGPGVSPWPWPPKRCGVGSQRPSLQNCTVDA